MGKAGGKGAGGEFRQHLWHDQGDGIPQCHPAARAYVEIVYAVSVWIRCPTRLRNNYAKKFNTSIQFWHETGGGLDEETIQELEEHGYQIRRNGVSNYTLNKKSRIVFIGKIPDDTDDIKSSKGYSELEEDVLLHSEK